MPQIRQKKKKTGALTKDSSKKKAEESASDSEIDCDAPKTVSQKTSAQLGGSKKKSGSEKRKENREAIEKKEAEEAARERDAKANAQMCKEAGNKAFAEGKWDAALLFFTEAIKHDPEDHVFFSNRSACNLQLKRTRDAVSDAEECVRLKSDWSKGYSRLGAAFLADMQGGAAKEAYEKGLKLDPGNAALLEGLALAITAAAEEVQRAADEAREEEEAKNPQGFVKQEDLGPEETTVIGIDLGTTYSCVGVWMNGAVEIIDDDSGSRTVPSWVAFTEDGGRLVGDSARQQAARNTKSTFYDIKRILGQKMNDGKVPDEIKRFAFDVVAEPTTNDPRIVVPALDNKQMPPEQISGMILSHMKRIAEKRLGHSVKKAVVTVPAYFNDAQRVATKAAGAVAGLDVLRVINEPTAAALAYGLDKKEDGDSTTILIFDLGGGTFDVSVLKIEGGMFVVQATGGDTHLGGEDFDNTVVDHFCDILKKKHKVEAKENPKLLRKLQSAVEKAKRALSSGVSAHVEVDDYSLELTRAKFESLNKAAFDRTLETVKNVMKDAKMDSADIDEIVLVGGSTRIPKIQEMLSEYFGGRDLNKSVNPDEAVAYGAAVQGAILSGVRHAATQALLLVDVTPLSLGIEVQGKHFSVIIPRNTSIPCKKRSEYTTTTDYQNAIQVPVFEGERPCIDGNRALGEFSIENIERAKKGEPKIEVTFDLDSNGILQVTARDKKTQAKADCRIEGACKGLDPAEIERMVKEAETFAKEDAEYSKQLEVKIELEACAYDLQDRAEAAGNEKAAKQAQEVLQWLDGIKKLGSKDVGRQLENKLRELRGC